jgi:hypothetical protein
MRSRTLTGWPSRAGNVALVIGGTCLGLILSELMVRLVAPQMTGPRQFTYDATFGAIPVPGYHGRRTLPGVYSYVYTNDSEGFRVVPGTAAASATTVLLLGDSFTYGVGVDDADTFAAQVQRRLPEVKVVNAGNGGKGTDYAVKFFRLKGARMEPRLTVLAFFPNDFCDNERQEYLDIAPDGRLVAKPLDHTPAAKRAFVGVIPGYDWLISWSHLANLTRVATIRSVFGVGRGPASDPHRPVRAGAMPGDSCVSPAVLELTRRYLDALREAVRRQGSGLVAFYIPDLLEAGATEPSGNEQAFCRLTRALGIDAFSMRPALRASGRPPSQLYFSEGHWTARAHTIAAEHLAPEVAARLAGARSPRQCETSGGTAEARR